MTVIAATYTSALTEVATTIGATHSIAKSTSKSATYVTTGTVLYVYVATVGDNDYYKVCIPRIGVVLKYNNGSVNIYKKFTQADPSWTDYSPEL